MPKGIIELSFFACSDLPSSDGSTASSGPLLVAEDIFQELLELLEEHVSCCHHFSSKTGTDVAGASVPVGHCPPSLPVQRLWDRITQNSCEF